MSRKIAATFALVVFALCLVQGIMADNTFSTTVSRALIAMAATFVLGLILGASAQRMLDDNLKEAEDLAKNQSAASTEEP